MVFDPPYGVKEYELDQIEMKTADRLLHTGSRVWGAGE
jgi:hypothetical protein